MDVLGLLRADHALLRTKLRFLESSLAAAPQARLALLGKCGSVLRLLNRHMERERAVVQLYYARVPAARYLTPMVEHSGEHDLLRAVEGLLQTGMRVSASLVVLRLSQAIDQLEEQMTRQEETVFASLEGAEDELARDTPPEIEGSMSINAILKRYPQTEPIFRELAVNRLHEGYESVDEVAWRHGMDAGRFLQRLRERAISPARF